MGISGSNTLKEEYLLLYVSGTLLLNLCVTFKKKVSYLLIWEGERENKEEGVEEDGQTEREKVSLPEQGAWDEGLNHRTPGSWPDPKTDA